MKSTILVLLILIGAAQAQQSFVASSPTPQPTTSQKFWSAENKIDFSVLAGQIAVDAITTQRGLANGFRETNPVIRPLGHPRGGWRGYGLRPGAWVRRRNCIFIT